MSLIDKAAQRMGRSRTDSLLERAAARGFASGQSAREQQEPQPSPQSPPPQGAPQGAPQGTPRVFPESPEAPIAAPAQRRSTEIKIDLARLKARGFISPDGRRSRLSEEVRLIKRRLMQRMTLFAREKVGDADETLGHVIMVTSARPEEGKSFLSLNLALSFIVDEGYNVLLIDADILRPTVLSTLGLKANRGLVDVLRDPTLEMADVLLRDHSLRLTLLPSGEPVASATELFGGPQMQEFVEKIARRYPDRVIIFDAPPVLASTEPLAIAQHVGQVLFVVEANQTSQRAVQSALELLEPCDNVSFVLNKATTPGSAEEFGTYYDAYQEKKVDTAEPNSTPST
jgi:protein-tyrosine kinase